MINRTDHLEPYPDARCLADLTTQGVPIFPAMVSDQQVMARNSSLALISAGPAHVEGFVHPAASEAERRCMVDAIHEAISNPAAFDGAWSPQPDGGWELWLGVE